MKLVVGLDGDGHFRVANYNDRLDVINLLKKLEDGNTWDNVDIKYIEHIEFRNLSEEDWNEFLCDNFVARGRCEIVEFEN